MEQIAWNKWLGAKIFQYSDLNMKTIKEKHLEQKKKFYEIDLKFPREFVSELIFNEDLTTKKWILMSMIYVILEIKIGLKGIEALNWNLTHASVSRNTEIKSQKAF